MAFIPAYVGSLGSTQTSTLDNGRGITRARTTWVREIQQSRGMGFSASRRGSFLRVYNKYKAL